MRVAIKRIDQQLPLPKYETAGAVGFDLVTRVTTRIVPGQVAMVPVNVVVEVPPGYVLLVNSRSSTAPRKGLLVILGVIDQDYRGPNDEIHCQVVNLTQEPITVERGERIGQGLLVRVEKAEWEEVEEMDGENRGAFGTTGK